MVGADLCVCPDKQESGVRIQNSEFREDRRHVGADLCVCPNKQSAGFLQIRNSRFEIRGVSALISYRTYNHEKTFKSLYSIYTKYIKS